MAASSLYTLYKTPLGENGCLGNHFIYWLPKHPVFLIHPNTVRLPMVTYLSLCSTYVTYGTLCRTIGHWVLPTQPLPGGAEDFPRGDRHFKHLPPLTYLIYLSPKEVY